MNLLLPTTASAAILISLLAQPVRVEVARGAVGTEATAYVAQLQGPIAPQGASSSVADVVAGKALVTAYTLGRAEETDDSPCIGAFNDNLCELYKSGVHICATNDYPKRARLILGDSLECIVLDRMNKRYTGQGRVDLATMNLRESKEWGSKVLSIKVK